MDYLLLLNLNFCKEIGGCNSKRRAQTQGALTHRVHDCDKKIQQMAFHFFV